MNQITIEKKVHRDLYRDLAWLYGAASDGDRYYMKDLLHIETEGSVKVLVTTDGKRLHLLRTEVKIFNDGDYVMQKRADYITLTSVPEDTVHFPLWRRVVPEKTVTLCKGMFINKKDMASCLYPLYNAGINVVVEYIEALSGQEWDISIAVPKQPVINNCLVFKSPRLGEKMALVMPRQNASRTLTVAADMREAIKAAR